MTQNRAYLGAALQYQDHPEVLSFVEPGSAMEYTIASTIRKLTQESKAVLGVLQGHGEPPLSEMSQLRDALKGRYNLQTISGVDSTGVPANVDVLLVARPENQLSTQAALAVDQYVMRGGRVIFALNRAQPLSTGLDSLLHKYGLPVRENLVRDRNATAVRVQQQRGGFNVVNRVRYPYIPQIANFSSHPISSGLDQAIFRFVSSLDTTEVDTTANLTVLARSSGQSATVSLPASIRPQQQWTVSDFSGSSIPIAGLLEGTFTSAFADADTLSVERTQSPETKLIVFGDGDFIVNGSGQQKQRLPGGNINLIANSVDYLADDTGLISLRTQRVTSRPLMQISPTTQTILKYLNVLLPILLVIGYGLVRYRRNQARRRRWKEDGVVA
jgi:gliding-associated putative ABC transporter substrate-binding component GldG